MTHDQANQRPEPAARETPPYNPTATVTLYRENPESFMNEARHLLIALIQGTI